MRVIALNLEDGRRERVALTARFAGTTGELALEELMSLSGSPGSEKRKYCSLSLLLCWHERQCATLPGQIRELRLRPP